MKINVDEFSSISVMLPGLFQFNENEAYTQTELGLTDSELLFYDDNAPSEIKGEDYRYVVKKRLSLDDYAFVINERLLYNRDLANMGRLVFVSEKTENNFMYYYYLEDRKQVATFLKALKKHRIKSKSQKVDLSPENM